MIDFLTKQKLTATIRWIWYDLDDTLWDFRTNSEILLERIYHERGLNRWFATPADWISKYEVHNRFLWREYAAARISREFLLADRFRKPLTDASHPQAREESEFLDKYYLQQLGTMSKLNDGAIETLTRLRQAGYHIGVLSNGFTTVQHNKIYVSGLKPLIDLTVLSDDIGINKPDVRLFNHAAQRAGAAPHECMMIGDNPETDIAGAIRAGWSAILFNPDYTTHRCAPEGTIASISKLPEICYFLLD